jgi:tRNA(fMet)-specific endonuclease VapC
VIQVDTSSLVDLMRESARGEDGPATRFLESSPDEILAASVFVLCELAAGAALARDPTRERERVARLSGSVETVLPGDHFAATYGRLLAMIQRSGKRVATMDLLIGTAAIEADVPLLTRNRKDFSRIPGLEVVAY